jgi:hypothetical protein
MLRSIFAVVVGYVVMAVGTMACVGLLDLLCADYSEAGAAGSTPPTFAIVLNLVLSTLCAGAGGYTASFVARRAPWQHAIALAALVLLFGVAYAVQMHGGPQPLWYLVLLPICGASGVVFGGWLRRRRFAIAPEIAAN